MAIQKRPNPLLFPAPDAGQPLPVTLIVLFTGHRCDAYVPDFPDLYSRRFQIRPRFSQLLTKRFENAVTEDDLPIENTTGFLSEISHLAKANTNRFNPSYHATSTD